MSQALAQPLHLHSFLFSTLLIFSAIIWRTHNQKRPAACSPPIFHQHIVRQVTAGDTAQEEMQPPGCQEKGQWGRVTAVDFYTAPESHDKRSQLLKPTEFPSCNFLLIHDSHLCITWYCSGYLICQLFHPRYLLLSWTTLSIFLRQNL